MSNTSAIITTIKTALVTNSYHTNGVISADIFHYGGTNYLVVVDRYSSFPFVRHIPRMTTNAVTEILMDRLFFEYGFPSTIMTDNGPQFRTTFEAFCKNLSIKCFASPYFPQSNGLAESAVKNCKYVLMKCKGDFKQFKKALGVESYSLKQWSVPCKTFFRSEIVKRRVFVSYQKMTKHPKITPQFNKGQKVRVQ